MANATPTPAAAALRAALDARVGGLERATRRVLERLALAAAAGRPVGPPLLLAGPPGSGKSALLEATAAALGRPLVVLDAARAGEGGLARAATAAVAAALVARAGGASCPLLALDGLDHAAEPERALEIGLGLDGALVFATTRHPALLPARVLDRCELVRLPGYTREEKVDLARRFLLPRAIDEAGAPAAAVELAPDAIERLAFAHSPEPGVRLLARRVAEVVRRAAARIALGEASAARLDAAAVDALLGPPPTSQTGLFARARRPEPGVAAAVVWGADGAEVALVEALRDRRAVVAREGAAALEASLALVDARADQLRVEAGALAGRDVSLRITGPRPLGDDGAADLAVFLAVASLATDRPVRHDVAAAGALSLRGAVRSVAGLAEKVLAAARAGARKVLVPAADFAALGAELPATALAAIEVVPVAHADDATREALIDIVIAQELR